MLFNVRAPYQGPPVGGLVGGVGGGMSNTDGGAGGKTAKSPQLDTLMEHTRLGYALCSYSTDEGRGHSLALKKV